MGFIVRGYCHSTLQEAGERFLSDADFYGALPIGTASVIGIASYPTSNSVRFSTSSNGSGNTNSTLTLVTCSTPGPMPWGLSSSASTTSAWDDLSVSVPFVSDLLVQGLILVAVAWVMKQPRRLR